MRLHLCVCTTPLHTSRPNTHTSSILSPVLRVPLSAAGLSGLMCLMKTPLIISPLLSLRPMPLPPIMLMPRDWPGARVSRTLKHTAGCLRKYRRAWWSYYKYSYSDECGIQIFLQKCTKWKIFPLSHFLLTFHCLVVLIEFLGLGQNNGISQPPRSHAKAVSFFSVQGILWDLCKWDEVTNAVNTSWETSHFLWTCSWQVCSAALLLLWT